ncbi:MAG: hypothetical protein RLY71_1464 [Pseudomonadota bacterium]|jgi:ribosomal protein S13
MVRQCLRRRIAGSGSLRQDVTAWQAYRDQLSARLDGQFTADNARVNLKRLYPTVQG